jgi:hypothetical protein
VQHALHVVAVEPADERHWTLALIDSSLGEDRVAALVAEAIVELPHPEDLSALVFDGSAFERQVLAGALEMVRATLPEVRPARFVDLLYTPRSRELDKWCFSIDDGPLSSSTAGRNANGCRVEGEICDGAYHRVLIAGAIAAAQLTGTVRDLWHLHRGMSLARLEQLVLARLGYKARASRWSEAAE